MDVMATSKWSFVVSCEHASRDIPEDLRNLGLADEELASHIAWDPGAREVSEAVAQALEVPLFAGRWSRLVADLNRSPENAEVVPESAFGVNIPGNRGLAAAARKIRLERYHEPYWTTVQAAIRRLLDAAPQTRVLHISVHSFVGELNGEVRSMPMGLLFDPDRALEAEVVGSLRRELEGRGVHAVENQPYDGRADALVTACRSIWPADRYVGIELEISQNHLGELDALSKHLVESLMPLRAAV